jgi:hypothetical protein
MVAGSVTMMYYNVMVTRMEIGVEPNSPPVFLQRRALRDDLPALPLRPLIAE